MNKNIEFDMAFSTFVDGQEYEKTEGVLFSLVSSAFYAGWKAAGGDEKAKTDLKSKYNNPEYRFRVPEKLKKAK